MVLEPGADDRISLPCLPVPSKNVAGRRPLSVRKKWLFRILSATFVPLLFLLLLELILKSSGVGYPTSFFIPAPDSVRQSGFGYVANQDFGRRFFPPGLTRQPLSVAITDRKPSGTYRIFVIGESAALGFPEPAFGFSRILNVLLRDRFPDLQFEIINTAMVAINSHAMVPIAQDCALHKPDLFVVLMGNNEVVGPFGASGVIGPYIPDLATIQWSLFARSTGIGQLLQRSWPTGGNLPGTPRSWKGMSMFLNSQVRGTDPRLSTIRNHFQANLREICRAGTAAGTPVIVSTIPVNLRDSAPFGSLHAVDLSKENLDEWGKLYRAGISATENGDIDTAIESFRRALRIDSEFGELHYRLGHLLLKKGPQHSQAARSHFLKARACDTLRFRADEEIQQAIRVVAADQSLKGVHLVDSEKLFSDSCEDRVPGSEYFLEHVHLNFEGNYLLARGLFEKITTILRDATHTSATRDVPPLASTACAHQLAFTAWSRLQLARQVEGLLMQPPFTNQSDAESRLLNHRKAIADLTTRLGSTELKTIATECQKGVSAWPEDWMIAINYCRILVELEDFEATVRLCEAILKSHPYVFQAENILASMHQRLGQTDQAIDHYRAALRLVPQFPEAEFGLARALASQGKFIEGLQIHEARVAREPDRSAALEQMAMFLIQIGRPVSAEQRLAEALKIDPENATAHAQKGMIAANDGDRPTAIYHLEQALRIRPGWPQVTSRLKQLKE